MLASVLVMSSSERSHEPALAVTSKQPVLSVTIATGSSPMLIAFLPGVSGSASSTWNRLVGVSLTCCGSDPAAKSESAGLTGQVVSATVPDADCRMNPYQLGGCEIPSCPGYGGDAVTAPVASRGVSWGDSAWHTAAGIAVLALAIGLLASFIWP